ncbi:MAG: DUF3306 domain-containing protein [Mangrovicoccus sp.]
MSRERKAAKSAGDFWSRRRAAVAAEEQQELQAEAQIAEAQKETALAERSDADLLAEAGLPEPEALTSPDQIRDFLQAELPQRLKTRALRRLWRLNPVLANIDGLVDYGEDFTDAAMVIPDLKTVYQVGRGMIAKLEELGADDEAGAQPSSEETAAEESAAHPAPAPQAAPAAAAPIAQTEPPEPAAILPASARRMRFQFDSAEG